MPALGGVLEVDRDSGGVEAAAPGQSNLGELSAAAAVPTSTGPAASSSQLGDGKVHGATTASSWVAVAQFGSLGSDLRAWARVRR